MHQKIEFCSYILWQGLPRCAMNLWHRLSPLESNLSHLPPLREVPHVNGKRLHVQADGEQQKPEPVRDQAEHPLGIGIAKPTAMIMDLIVSSGKDLFSMIAVIASTNSTGCRA